MLTRYVFVETYIGYLSKSHNLRTYTFPKQIASSNKHLVANSWQSTRSNGLMKGTSLKTESCVTACDGSAFSPTLFASGAMYASCVMKHVYQSTLRKHTGSNKGLT